MHDVQIFKPAHGTATVEETLQAKSATVSGSTLILHDVIDTRYNNDGFVSAAARRRTSASGFRSARRWSQFVSTSTTTPGRCSSKSLRAQVNALKRKESAVRRWAHLQINLANKLAWPFASLYRRSSLAMPLALRFGKRGRTLGIALAVIAFFVYYLHDVGAVGLRTQRSNRSVRRRLDAEHPHGPWRVRSCSGWKSADAVRLRRRMSRGLAAMVCLVVVCERFDARFGGRPRRSTTTPNRSHSCFSTSRPARSTTRRRRDRRSGDRRASNAGSIADPANSARPARRRRRRTRPDCPVRSRRQNNGTYQLYPTPRPPPGQSARSRRRPFRRRIPESRNGSNVPIFLERGGDTPPPITPAGQHTPTPSPEPTGVPTLAPGLRRRDRRHASGRHANKANRATPIGNVHIYYGGRDRR